MTFALVGLAAGMGARYPRFNAENLTQVAGSYGGIAFMVLAVLFILARSRSSAGRPRSTSTPRCGSRPLTDAQLWMMVTAFTAAAGLSLALWLFGDAERREGAGADGPHPRLI